MFEVITVGYKFTPYHETVSDDELISDLIRVSQRVGSSTITQQQYREFGKYGIDKVVYRFHSWNEALVKAKLQTSANYQYSRKELFENIERVWTAKGKQPVRADMNNKTLSSISSGAYLRRFGTWTNALQSFVEYMNEDDPDSNSISLIESAQGQNTEVRNINLRLRWKVMNRDSFKCCCCGASPATDPAVTLHVDHIIPYSRGGKTTIENLQTLCSKCNLGKGNLL